jgi:acyl dehydratase
MSPVVGQIIPLGPYPVKRSDLLEFAAAFDPQPFHLDESIANSSILMRMICDAFFLKVDALGSTGIEEMKWLKPVYVDDVLSGQMKITSIRNSRSKPDRLIVNFEADVWDQKNNTKARMVSMVFIRNAES